MGWGMMSEYILGGYSSSGGPGGGCFVPLVWVKDDEGETPLDFADTEEIERFLREAMAT